MLGKPAQILLGATLVGSITTLVSQPSYANTVQFYCANNSGSPTTMARNLQQNRALPVIIWESQYFAGSGYDPFTRCKHVSARFQKFYNQNKLDYLTAGPVNGYQVICATSYGGLCSGSNVLFTLEPGANPEETLQELFDVRHLSSPPLRRGGSDSGYSYVDIVEMLAPLGINTQPEGTVLETPEAAAEEVDSQPEHSAEPPIPVVSPN